MFGDGEASGEHLARWCPAQHFVWFELTGRTTSLAHAILHQIEPTTIIRLLFPASFPFLALAGRVEMQC